MSIFHFANKIFYVLYIGYHVIEEQLQTIAKQSQVLEADKEFFFEEFRATNLEIIPFPEFLKSQERCICVLKNKTIFQLL